MISLLGMVLGYPWVGQLGLRAFFTNAVLLTTGVYAVSQSHRRAMAVGSLGALQMIVSVVALETGSTAAGVLAASLLMAFQVATLAIVLRYVVRGRTVTPDQLCGAVSVYLLLGFAWASAYGLVTLCQHDAFVPMAKPDHVRTDLVYFSFVTLLTIGYGDITPAPGLARSLAILEGITGLFYVAILVSRLVSLMQSEPEETQEAP